jgi:predicted nucleic acid-binding protein
VTYRLMVVDTCSIMNFSAIDRMALFNTAVRGRGRWTQAVEGEVRRFVNTLAFRSLSALVRGNWLGESIELDSDQDRDAVEDIRAALGGTLAAPLQHLGEAESIRAIESVPSLKGAVFLTDDGDARYLADRRGITVKNTRWLLADAYSMGDMRCPEPFDVLGEMWDASRAVPLLESHTEICP